MSSPPAPRLSPTSFIVLGVIDLIGPSSPYRLKKLVERSIADFHPVPHTTLYEEPARLSAAGYLDESQEEGGRRTKRYSLTDRGREALAAWLAEPETEPTVLRSPAMLKVFFGADPAPLAAAQLPRHRELLAGFEAWQERPDGPPAGSGARRALETGVEYHRWWIKRWEGLA